MATSQRAPDIAKASFAKIAASSKDALPTTFPTHVSTPAAIPLNSSVEQPIGPPQPDVSALATKPGTQNPMQKVSVSLAELSLQTKAPSPVVIGSGVLGTGVVVGSGISGVPRPPAGLSRESGSDESQKADSSSELGTKPPSLDGKSITSGTTFALDEKESLRPDDSASVKAAAEDDDSMSIRGSFAPGSRMGSDVAARSRILPDRRLVPPPMGGLPGPGVMTPQSISSEQPGSVGASSDALQVIYRQAPDDKLLEALTSPKDRIFLLRLEKDVIDFVQDSKEPYMDLPPSNSFCRMLTHKLADYYHMTHSFEPQIGAVRIFRTPFCRVPPSLALMSPPADVSTSGTPPPMIQPKKIMRRGEEDDSGPVSAEASKSASELDNDDKDEKDKSNTASQKMTREEREEMYKLARERIFGNSDDNLPDTDDNSMSRPSSVSANRPPNRRGKSGRQRREDSNSFDSRSQYATYWGSHQQAWVPQQGPAPYIPSGNQQYPTAHIGPQYQGQTVLPVYAHGNSQGYPIPGSAPSGAGQSFPQQQYPTPQPPYQHGNVTAAPYGPSGPSRLPAQGWQGSQQTTAPTTPTRGGRSQQPSIPYAFGQLPANMNPHDPKTQHPIPGSYNRNHNFNPKTQSFVPGGNMGPPPPQPPFTAPGSHHSSSQIGTPHLAYPGFQHSMPPPYGGYGMARQGSSSSISSFHGSPHMPPHIPPHLQHGLPPNPHLPPHPPHPIALAQQMPQRPNLPPGSHQHYNNLPAYGNPATLPQKPNTGI